MRNGKELAELQRMQLGGARVVWGSRCLHNKGDCQRSSGPYDACEHSFESYDVGADDAKNRVSIDGPDVEILSCLHARMRVGTGLLPKQVMVVRGRAVHCPLYYESLSTFCMRPWLMCDGSGAHFACTCA